MTVPGMKKVVGSEFDQILSKIPKVLKSEKFGVLTEIDVKETLKKKLDADFRRYRILGACNPPLAHRALSADLDVGLMLPCNVIVYENDGGGATVVAIDPVQTPAAQSNDRVKAVAEEVRSRLARVLERLE
jgi:uncharacterized protein (DUF302 family)